MPQTCGLSPARDDAARWRAIAQRQEWFPCAVCRRVLALLSWCSLFWYLASWTSAWGPPPRASLAPGDERRHAVIRWREIQTEAGTRLALAVAGAWSSRPEGVPDSR